jgi:hypothetical protein
MRGNDGIARLSSVSPSRRTEFGASHLLRCGYTSQLVFTTKPVEDHEDLNQLVIRAIDAFGEAALGVALVRAVEDLPYHPLDASLRHLVPAVSRQRAVMVEAHVLTTRFAEQLRHLVRPR